MAKVVAGRFTADVDGDFVVFIIGMRVNKPLKLRNEYEAVYGNMPVFGLAKATNHVPVGKRGDSAGRRIGARTTDEPLPS